MEDWSEKAACNMRTLQICKQSTGTYRMANDALAFVFQVVGES